MKEIRAKLLEETGFDISPELLRKYEDLGLFPKVNRLGKKAKFRDYSDEQFGAIKNIIISRKLGIGFKDLGDSKKVSQIKKNAKNLK